LLTICMTLIVYINNPSGMYFPYSFIDLYRCAKMFAFSFKNKMNLFSKHTGQRLLCMTGSMKQDHPSGIILMKSNRK
ncbi:MAG: hypothetical protein ACOYKE_14200, partial [Ferruginibacter sp.]